MKAYWPDPHIFDLPDDEAMIEDSRSMTALSKLTGTQRQLLDDLRHGTLEHYGDAYWYIYRPWNERSPKRTVRPETVAALQKQGLLQEVTREEYVAWVLA